MAASPCLPSVAGHVRRKELADNQSLLLLGSGWFVVSTSSSHSLVPFDFPFPFFGACNQCKNGGYQRLS